MFIHKNISYLQKKERLTQNEFGELFGLGKGVINSYVTGKAMPKLETVIAICKYFKLNINDFVHEDLSQIEEIDSNNIISENQILSQNPGYGFMIVGDLEEEISKLKTKLINAYERIDELREKNKH